MQRYYNFEQIRAIYDKMSTNIEKLRSISSTPLTLSEKIITGHMNYDSITTYTTGKNYIFLKKLWKKCINDSRIRAINRKQNCYCGC